MAQISKYPINQDVLNKIEEALADSILNLRSKKEVEEFLTAILTKTERKMVVKRFAIAVLVVKGYRYESIKEILNVSQGTIFTVKNKLARAGEAYLKAVEKVIKKDKLKKIFLKIEQILDILPPKGGDWSEWRRKKYKRELEIQEPF